MNDFALAGLCAAAYVAAPDFAAGDVHAVLTGDVLAFRGTEPDSAADWCRDLDALPVEDAQLGWCHRGFLDGARAVLPGVLRGTARPLTLAGHSLGGALAVLTAGLLVAAGRPVAAVVTFGAPRAGGERLRAVLMGVPVRQYRHGDDPVPEVPWLPGVFEHVAALLPIGVPAADPIADHMISGYLAALATPANAALEAA